jgi:hypothetical protein
LNVADLRKAVIADGDGRRRSCRNLGAKEMNFCRKNYRKVIQRFGRKGLPFYSKGCVDAGCEQ